MSQLNAAQLAQIQSYSISASLKAAISAGNAGNADVHPDLPANVKSTTVRCADGRSNGEARGGPREYVGC